MIWYVIYDIWHIMSDVRNMTLGEVKTWFKSSLILMPMPVLKTLYWYFIWVSFQVSMNTVVSMAFTFGYVKVNWDSCLFSVHISNFFPICMRMFPISCLFVCVSFQLLSSISSTFFRSFLCLRASLTGYTCLVWNCPGELKSI